MSKTLVMNTDTGTKMKTLTLDDLKLLCGISGGKRSASRRRGRSGLSGEAGPAGRGEDANTGMGSESPGMSNNCSGGLC